MVQDDCTVMEKLNVCTHRVLAERVGFEPTKGYKPFTRLAGERLRPYSATSPCLDFQ